MVCPKVVSRVTRWGYGRNTQKRRGLLETTPRRRGGTGWPPSRGLAEAQDALEAALARVAVEQGSADLQFFLGLTRWRGEGPNGEVALKDPEEAVRWFRMAAEQGHAEAQYNLGLAYHEWGRRLRG